MERRGQDVLFAFFATSCAFCFRESTTKKRRARRFFLFYLRVLRCFVVDFHRFRASPRDMKAPRRINHEEAKSTKDFSCSIFVFFVASWLIFIVSGRRHVT